MNGKKFVFPKFEFHEGTFDISCPAGYITWRDFHSIYEKDKSLSSHLRKAPKILYQTLHPGNNKQNVPLAIAIFHETTIAAAQSYFPDRRDMNGFLSIFNFWWNISNSKMRFSPNPLSSAVVFEDKKTDYYCAMANWIDKWSSSPAFTLTTQTASALSQTL